jgi:hypothetical protein
VCHRRDPACNNDSHLEFVITKILAGESGIFLGINDKGTIPRMQYITIRASPPLEERRKYLPEPGQKRGWQEDCSNQSSAIHIQKASLHLTTHIPCVPPGAPPYMSAAAPLLSPEGKTVKERVALDLLVRLQNQEQWRLLLSSSRLSLPTRPNGAPHARLLLPSR